MSKKLEIKSGEQYNDWTILYEVEQNKYNARQFMCRCKCGTEEIKLLNSLRGKNKKNSPACGECNRVKWYKEVPIGEVVNGWKVIKELPSRLIKGKTNNYERRFLCECDGCGKESNRGINQIYKSGCRCKVITTKYNNLRYNDLTNIQFNRLYVMKYAYTKNNRAYFKCMCDCGVIKNIRSDKLTSNSTQSCGCYSKEQVIKTHSGENNKYYGTGPMLGRKGKTHPAWKGGKTPESKLVRSDIRASITPIVYSRDDYTCNKCGIRGTTLNAHHIYDFATYEYLQKEEYNLVTLCENCHKEFHSIYPGYYTNTLVEYEEWLGHTYKYRKELMEKVNNGS